MPVHTASRIPADLAGCGWYEILPPPAAWEPLSRNITADWVIIGAGFAGLSAARRLTERCPEDKVVVLEAQRIAWGAAGRNSGFMCDLPHELNSASYAGEFAEDRKQIRMNRIAIRYAAGIAEEFGLQAHFSTAGKYHGAVGRRGLALLEDFSAHLDQLGEPSTSLDRAQLAEVTGSDFYAGGIHAPGAAIIQPAGYIRGLADGLRRRVTLYENSPVVKIHTGPVHLVHTPHGRVSAPRIILAVNGHAQSFGFHRKRLMHVFTFASMTRALSGAEQKKLGGRREWGLVPADPLGSTVRRYRDRIIIRNTFTWNPSLQTNPAQVARLGRGHARAFARRFPMLKGVTMQYRWGGALCLSLNSVPAFGEVAEGIYSAVCQNGLGTAKGTYSGMAVVDLATGQDNAIVADMLSYDPPRKLYPQPFLSVGAKSMLWWQQWRAAGER